MKPLPHQSLAILGLCLATLLLPLSQPLADIGGTEASPQASEQPPPDRLAESEPRSFELKWSDDTGGGSADNSAGAGLEGSETSAGLDGAAGRIAWAQMDEAGASGKLSASALDFGAQDQAKQSLSNSAPPSLMSELGDLPEPLPGDDAFALSHSIDEAGNTAVFSWEIAEGYYLYRDKLAAAEPGPSGPAPLEIAINGISVVQSDDYFGDVDVYFNAVEFVVGLDSIAGSQIEVRWQGCSDIHKICYPPERRLINIAGGAPGAADWGITEPESFFAETLKREGGRWLLILLMFLAGVALSFTPCVLPMIPILTGVLGGDYRAGKSSSRRLFLLGLTYVLAMALSYSLLGVAVGLTGQAFASQIQHPAVIAVSAAIVVVMALWIMGVVRLRLPSGLSSRLQQWQSRLPGGRFATAALAGCFASLIVSPCISPPLVAALIFVSQTGEWLFGGLALFALGLGMGVLVLAACLGAQQLLPRAGQWMDSVNLWLGVALMLVAIWMIEKLLAGVFVDLLLAAVLVGATFSEGVFDLARERSTKRQRLYHGFLALMLVYALILFGKAVGGQPPAAPAIGVVASGSSGASAALGFQAVSNIESVRAATQSADGRISMLDIYADWCVSCRELEEHTFTSPQVAARMGQMSLLRLDVTDFDTSHQQLFSALNVFGPPTLLFFDANGKEIRGTRVIGFLDAGDFSAHLDSVLGQAAR